MNSRLALKKKSYSKLGMLLEGLNESIQEKDLKFKIVANT